MFDSLFAFFIDSLVFSSMSSLSYCLIAYSLVSMCLCFFYFFLIIDVYFYTIMFGKDAYYDFNILKFIETCSVV